MPERITQTVAITQNRTPFPAQRRAPEAAREDGNRLPEGGKDAPQKPPPPPMELAVEQINRYLSESRRDLMFEVDQQSGRTVIRVVNPETQEVIREIPPKETRRLADQIAAGAARILDITA